MTQPGKFQDPTTRHAECLSHAEQFEVGTRTSGKPFRGRPPGPSRSTSGSASPSGVRSVTIGRPVDEPRPYSKESYDAPVFQGCATERLCDAIKDLVGRGAGPPGGCPRGGGVGRSTFPWGRTVRGITARPPGGRGCASARGGVRYSSLVDSVGQALRLAGRLQSEEPPSPLRARRAARAMGGLDMDGLQHTVTLSNGVRMPLFGFGVWRIPEGEQVLSAVRTALDTGYRSIDTATLYRNEEGVGRTIRESGLPRGDLFVTTKVWNSDQGYDQTLRAFDASLERLAMDYVDLYLVHWPVKGKYNDTWRAVERLYEQGLTRAIGVSNFQVHHLQDVMAHGHVAPMVNQVELHPLLAQRAVRAFCAEHHIQVEAWSPLMQGHLDIPVLERIGALHGKTPAQVVLRWDIQNGIVTIPKSMHAERIRQNADIFDFELSAEDMRAIDDLDAGRRFGADPDNFNF